MTSAVYTREFFCLQKRWYYILLQSKFYADYDLHKNNTLKPYGVLATAP